MPEIILHEVGPRDGLQMEKETVPLERKLAWIRAALAAGIDIVQVGSFVHPKLTQMADTDELFRRLLEDESRPEGLTLSGLVLNERGLERALACGCEMVCTGVSASETHSRKNTRMSPAEAAERVINIARQAVEQKLKVQVSVQSAFGCGFEGAIPQEKVLDLVKGYLDAGLTSISLADTAGMANPDQVERLFGAIRELDDSAKLACHLHNTYGLGLVNCQAALSAGVTCFESAFGGLGGCPFTAVAGGNVCTEDFVHLLQALGQRQDLKLDRLIELTKDVAAFFGRQLPGAVYQALRKEAESE